MKIIIIIIIIALNSCCEKIIITEEKYKLEEIINKEEDTLLKSIIKPYKTKIDLELQDTLSYIDKTMIKGTPDGELGNYIADLCMNKYKNISDFCLINNGGIRSTLDSGHITKKDIYKIMPFDNKLVTVEVNYEDIKKILIYLSKQKEPVSGIKISNNSVEVYNYKNKSWNKIETKSNHNDKIFTVLTSDYLAQGGDNMFFFKEKEKTNTGQLMRDLIIEQISKHDTIKYINKKRYE